MPIYIAGAGMPTFETSVFLVFLDYELDGRDFHGVFKTRELAEDYITRQSADDRHRQYYNRCRKTCWRIEEEVVVCE